MQPAGGPASDEQRPDSGPGSPASSSGSSAASSASVVAPQADDHLQACKLAPARRQNAARAQSTPMQAVSERAECQPKLHVTRQHQQQQQDPAKLKLLLKPPDEARRHPSALAERAHSSRPGADAGAPAPGHAYRHRNSFQMHWLGRRPAAQRAYPRAGGPQAGAESAPATCGPAASRQQQFEQQQHHHRPLAARRLAAGAHSLRLHLVASSWSVFGPAGEPRPRKVRPSRARPSLARQPGAASPLASADHPSAHELTRSSTSVRHPMRRPAA